jgi:hypothetical protein
MELQQAQQLINQFCAIFADCANPATRDFVAAGITTSAEGPTVVVWSRDAKRTRSTIVDRVGPSLADQVQVAESGTFRQAGIASSPLRGRGAAGLLRPLAGLRVSTRRLKSWLQSTLGAGVTTLCPGEDLENGTLGCGLEQKAHAPGAYFLTAEHVLPPMTAIGAMVSSQGQPVGKLIDSSTVEKGLDWALVEAFPEFQPSAKLCFDTMLTLSGPMPSGDLGLVNQQVIGMSGATSAERRSGKVVATGAIIAVDEPENLGRTCIRYIRSNQILVEDLSGPHQKHFGEAGDSGAVAYTLSSLSPSPSVQYLPGTAIGLYWRVTDRPKAPASLHALAPVVDILTAIKGGRTQLDLKLWP